MLLRLFQNLGGLSGRQFYRQVLAPVRATTPATAVVVVARYVQHSPAETVVGVRYWSSEVKCSMSMNQNEQEKSATKRSECSKSTIPEQNKPGIICKAQITCTTGPLAAISVVPSTSPPTRRSACRSNAPRPQQPDVIPNEYIVIFKPHVTSEQQSAHRAWVTEQCFSTLSATGRGQGTTGILHEFNIHDGQCAGYAAHFPDEVAKHINDMDEVTYTPLCPLSKRGCLIERIIKFTS